MKDGIITEEDVGDSEWKLFSVFDAHGGPERMQYMVDNLVDKVNYELLSWMKIEI